MLAIDLQAGPLAEFWRFDPCAALYELAARLPGQPLQLELGNETMLLFQDAAAARHVSRTRPDNYRKNFGAFVDFFGESRITSDGERWARLQQLSQPSISATEPALVVDSARRNFSAAITAMLQEPAEAVVAVDRHLDRAAATVIAEVTFGFGVDDISPTLIDDFRDVLRYSSLTTWNVPGARRADDERRRMATIEAAGRVRGGIDDLLVRGNGTAAASPLLRALVEAPEEDVDLVGEICSLLFAGSDTSATSLGWAMYLLANAPALQDRLNADIRSVLGDGPPTLEGVLGLESVAAFQNEAMRIFPPIPILSRVAVEADTIGDVAVAAGQKVLISVIGLHHDSRTFPEPRRVSLDRFPHGASPRDPMAHFQPFGTGRRACGGARIANIEVATALTLLIGRLQMSIGKPEPLGFEWLASLRRRGGQHIKLAAR